MKRYKRNYLQAGTVSTLAIGGDSWTWIIDPTAANLQGGRLLLSRFILSWQVIDNTAGVYYNGLYSTGLVSVQATFLTVAPPTVSQLGSGGLELFAEPAAGNSEQGRLYFYQSGDYDLQEIEVVQKTWLQCSYNSKTANDLNWAIRTALSLIIEIPDK